MASNSEMLRCSKCEELQRLYLSTLQDKRTILIRLQKEIEQGRKQRDELESIRKEERQATSQRNPDTTTMEYTKTKNTFTTNGSEMERRLSEAMTINRKWMEEYEELRQKYKTDTQKMQGEINTLQQKLEETNTHIYALESENMRLAKTLSGRHPSPPNQNSNDESELMKFQMQAYQEDFSCERRDRERAQSEKESLQEQLRSAQEIISTLTEEIEVYKAQHESDQEEIRHLVNRQPVAEPQLQLVYPVVNHSQQRRENRWRHNQQRRGIYTRGPTLPPPSAFYGGEVEVDQADGPTCKSPIPDGYRSV